MATLQGKAVKNTYRQVLQIGANNVGVSASLQPVQDGAGVNTALSLSTIAATVNGDLTITGDLIITGGGIQIKDLIDDTVAALIQNGTGITWTYNDGAATLTGNFTGTTSVVPEGSNLYYTQGRFDSAFAAKSTTNLAEGTNLYFTTARGNANFATNLAASDTDDLAEGATNLYFTNARARTALSVTAGTGLSYNNTTGVFNLAAIPNASLSNSSITINSQSVALGGSVTLTTTNIAEGTNLYWTDARFDSRFGTKTTTNLAEGTNLYYTQARFNTAFAAKSTTDLAEGTNLYYTDARSRLALSSTATGLTYANNSGIFSLTAGYEIPTTVKLGQYDIAYNRSIVSAAVSGTTTKTLSLTQQDANVVTATWTDLGITTINGTANQIAATTVGNTTTIGFTNDVTMPNNLVVSGNLTINGTATYVNTESISSKDPLFEVANTNNTTDAVDIGYYGRYYDAVQERVEFTGLFRDASDAGKFKIFTGLVDEPTNVVNTTGTGYTVATLVANVDGNLNGTANAANILSTARTIAASGDAAWSVSFDGSANVTSALTLANTGVTATTYGTSTAVPTIAVDAKGRITSASNTNITFPVTTVNGFAGTVVLTTSDVAEGTNQYFTTARAQASITGGASSVVTANLTASRALVSDGSGKIAASATTTTTEIGYLAGVTSAIQTQLDSKLNLTGGTLTGGLIGTTGSFSSSGSGNTFTIGHTSGSGIALNITKGGNGEGLYINKTSGSGNAATIIGTLNATTLVKSGGTASQFLKADGSVDSNAYLPLTGGTLTGALSGTSATFAGRLQVTNNNTAWNSFSTNQLRIAGTASGQAMSISLTDGVNSNGWIGYQDSATAANRYLYMSANDGASQQFTLSSTGAATFSSSVTATQLNASISTSGAVASVPNLAYFKNQGSGYVARIAIGDGTTSDSYISHTGGNTTATQYLGFGVNAYNQMVLNGNGDVAIGTSSPIDSNKLTVLMNNNTNGTGIAIKALNDGGTASQPALSYFNGSGNLIAKIVADNGTGFLAFNTGSSNTERARFTSGGFFKASNNGTYVSTSGASHELYSSQNSNYGVIFSQASAVPYGLSIRYTTTSPNITGDQQFIACADTTNDKFIVWSSGTTVNRTGVYGTISDSTLKENIIDATPKLDKILQLKVRNFNFIGEDLKQLGFVAQEMEEVFPNMVDKDKEGLKSVKTTVLIPMLVKAIQEQQAQIEELKAMIAAK
jgi:hypothetical protein